MGIEAKAAATISSLDTRELRLLLDKLGARFKASIINYPGAHTLPFGEQIWAVPVSGRCVDWHRIPTLVPRLRIVARYKQAVMTEHLGEDLAERR
ncbi:MAG: hypothetical protein WBQ21_10220 [Solirubrobacteraceae bacterium]